MSKVYLHLTVQENNDAELAFELFKSEPEQNILERDLFLDAFKFFLDQYDEVKEGLRTEIIQHIQKVNQSLMNLPYFVNLVQKIKIANRGMSKKNPTELNNNFIMQNLDQKHIVHLDRCWGRFDNRKFGFILANNIRNCVNTVLSKYNTLNLDYQPTYFIEEQKTVSSPVLKEFKVNQTDSVELEEKREKTLTNSGNQQQKYLLKEIAKQSNKQDIQNYKNNYQSNEINDWIFSMEQSKAVSFEQFANFMAHIIVENKLKFKVSKESCSQCSIF